MKGIKAVSLILTTTASHALQVHAQPFLTNGLVAYYLYNGSGNANVLDSSGNGNNGLIIGTDWQYSPDRFGNPDSSLSLNLTDPPDTNAGTYIAAPRGTALDFNQDFTLSVWISIPNGIPAGHVHNLISDGIDQTSANFRLISAADGTNDYLQFVANPLGAGVDLHSFLIPLRNTWWQAVVVRSGTNMSLYQNGAQVAVTNSAVAALLNLPQVWLGSMPLTTNETQSVGEYPLDGGIDDVRMYSRALSASEVQQLYVAESAPILNLAKAVQPTFSNLAVGTNYQLQVSLDLFAWTNQGSPFTATNSTVSYPQFFNVANWSQLFFRLQVAP